MKSPSGWDRFGQFYFEDDALGFALDTSRIDFAADAFEAMRQPVSAALQAMRELEAGAIANPDEQRMVGHYWLRAPHLAPQPALRAEIEQALADVKSFVAKVHSGALSGAKGQPFRHFLLAGIGGSALGPQLVADALGTSGDKMQAHFLDNTDPDGLNRGLKALDGKLDQTLVVVISKSGGTPETRNGMLAAQAAYAAAGLDFGKHAVAVTSEGSKLHKVAMQENWLTTFPMWDWVGGRTSVTSTVGLVPAALQGLDIDALLAGARAMDELTRRADPAANPAALLAMTWHSAGKGKGLKDMVILPYKDRLVLFSKYLQQLIMESIGKERDLNGNVVHQGIAVYGNKGSTDQHAYVQQLRDGLNNFFATFIEVQRDDAGSGSGALEVDPGVTAGDYLAGFMLGTRQALHENGRESITITIRELNAHSLGMLIALFERTVGIYAAMVGINAYHQPGVEAGKKAAAAVLDLQARLLALLAEQREGRTAREWAEALGAPEQAETIFKLLGRLAANGSRGVTRKGSGVDAIFTGESL